MTDDTNTNTDRLDALEARIDRVEELITTTDQSGREWTPTRLITELGLSRRQALVAIGLLAGGASLPVALSRTTSAQSGAAGTLYVEQLGDSSNRVQTIYADTVDQLSSTTTVSNLTVNNDLTTDTGSVTQAPSASDDIARKQEVDAVDIGAGPYTTSAPPDPNTTGSPIIILATGGDGMEITVDGATVFNQTSGTSDTETCEGMAVVPDGSAWSVSPGSVDSYIPLKIV